MKDFINFYDHLFSFFDDNGVDLDEYSISFNYHHDSYCEFILHSYPFNSSFLPVISFCEYFTHLKNEYDLNVGIFFKDYQLIIKVFRRD